MVATDPDTRTLRREISGAFRACGYDGALLYEPRAPGAPPTPLRPPVPVDVSELGTVALGRMVFADAGDGVWRPGRVVRNATDVLLSELDSTSAGTAALNRRVSILPFSALSGAEGRALFEQQPEGVRARCSFVTVLDDGRVKFRGAPTLFHGAPFVSLGSLSDLRPDDRVLIVEGSNPDDPDVPPADGARFYAYHPSFLSAGNAVPNV
jgi:hypothetical protein